MIRRHVLTFILTVLTSLGTNGPVLSETAINPSPRSNIPAATAGGLENISARADAIVVGSVTSTRSYWNAARNLIYTDATVSVEDTIKGASGRQVTVTALGGQLGDMELTVSQMARFRAGERSVLFLKRNADNSYSTIDGSRGQRLIEDAMVDERTTLSQFVTTVKASMGVSGQSLPAGTAPLAQEPVAMTFPGVPAASAPAQQSVSAQAGWQTVMTQTFEGAFPGTGTLWGVSGNPTWGATNYKASSGSYSAWPAKAGTLGVDPATSNYANNMNAWMVYGPFSLSDATDGQLNFSRWLDSEYNVDKFKVGASTNLPSFLVYSTSGNSGGWVADSFDLKDWGTLGNLTGQPQVWIAFIFSSDAANTAKGAFVDDVEIKKYVGARPAISNITPTSASAGTDTQVTISGSNFGATQSTGNVTFYYQDGEPRIVAPVVSWSDTSIVVKVPVGTINGYAATASTGPVIVTSGAGGESDGYQFSVTFSYMGARWAGQHPLIRYRINPNTADTTGEETAFQAAAQAWTDVAGAAFDFVYDGASSATAGTRNDVNEMLWRSLGQAYTGVIAWAMTWKLVGSTAILEYDIEFNDDFTWSTTGEAGKMDVQNIATHELGHALGLRDLYGDTGTPNDTEKTMYGKGETGETKKRTLDPADIDGIRWIYGTKFAVSSYATGNSPFGLAAADLDGDGKTDLVTANGVGNTVSVFINNGNGTFKSKVDYATGNTPQGVVIADLDGDGKPDLALTNYTSNTVSVLKNNGNGTFQAKVDYPTGNGPVLLATADLDGDGHPDLAAANRNSNTVSVLLNNGNGTFQSKVDYTVGTRPRPVAVGDLNGDGHPDLVAGNDDGGNTTVSVLLNNGDGTFQNKTDYATGVTALSIAIADLDGDGIPDLAVGNYESGTASLFVNKGDGTFKNRVDYAIGTIIEAVAVADFDSDGHPDIAVTNYSGNALALLLNNGDGTFQSKIEYPVTQPYQLTTADFDNDGKPDLAVTRYNANTVAVFLQTANETSTAVTYPNGGETVTGTINVTANVSVVGAPVNRVAFEYSSDRGKTWTSIGADTTSPYSVSWNTATVADGTRYLIRATATDNNNATSQDVSSAVFTVYNNQPPTVAVTYPNGGEEVNGTVAVTADASDPDGTVSQVTFEYSGDDGTTWNTITSDTTSPYSAPWNTTSLTDGTQYLIRATAKDNSNSTSLDVSDAVFTVENNQPPTVAVTYPNGGEKVKGTVTVTADAGDPDGTVAQVAFEYSSNNGSTWNAIATDTTAPYSASWNTAALTDGGQYLVRATAKDDKDTTTSDVSNAVFRVDNTVPGAPNLLSPSDGAFSASATPALDWSDVTDPSGVTYDLQVDDDPAFGSLLIDVSSLPASNHTPAAAIPNGTYSWRVRTVDGAGSTGAWTSSRSFTVATSVLWWKAQLKAAAGELNDNENYAGVAADAAVQSDSYDVVKPAVPAPPYVRLVFPHAGWPTNPGDYAEDIRPPAAYLSWAFEVTNSADGDVTITWDVAQVPQTYQSVSLVDGATGDVLAPYLRTAANYVYTAQAGVPRSFKFVVAESNTVLATGWNMFSLPADLTAAGDDFANASVFGDEYPGGTSLYVYWFNPAKGAYDMWSSASRIFAPAMGKGYWLRAYSAKTIGVNGYPAPDKDYIIHLSPGWNQIGQPFNYAVSWGSALVSYQGNTVGIVQASTNNWVSKYLYRFDPASGSYVMDTAPAGSLDPWRGYWVKAIVAADLIIPHNPTP